MCHDRNMSYIFLLYLQLKKSSTTRQSETIYNLSIIKSMHASAETVTTQASYHMTVPYRDAGECRSGNQLCIWMHLHPASLAAFGSLATYGNCSCKTYLREENRMTRHQHLYEQRCYTDTEVQWRRKNKRHQQLEVRPPLHWKATIHASGLLEKFNSKTM